MEKKMKKLERKARKIGLLPPKFPRSSPLASQIYYSNLFLGIIAIAILLSAFWII